MFTNNSKESVSASSYNTGSNHDYQITINFIPVDGDLPSFTVYRKLRSTEQEARPSEDMKAYKLPLSHPSDVSDILRMAVNKIA